MPTVVAVIVADDLRAVAAVAVADPGPKPCADLRANPVHFADPGSELSADDPRAYTRTDPGSSRIPKQCSDLRRRFRPHVLCRSSGRLRSSRLHSALPGNVRLMPTPIVVSIANNHLRAVVAAERGPEPSSELSANDPRPHSRTDPSSNGSAD